MFKAQNSKMDGICYEDITIDLVCSLLRKYSFDFNQEKNENFAKVNEFNEKIVFKDPVCVICEDRCFQNYEGSFNIMMTESMIRCVAEKDFEFWIQNLYFQFQERFQLKNFHFQKIKAKFKIENS